MSDHVARGPMGLGCVPTLPAFHDGWFTDQFHPDLFPCIATLKVQVETSFVFGTAEVNGHISFDVAHYGLVATMPAFVFLCIAGGTAVPGQRC